MAVTFSEIPNMTQRNSLTFVSEKVGRYKIAAEKHVTYMKTLIHLVFLSPEQPTCTEKFIYECLPVQHREESV